MLISDTVSYGNCFHKENVNEQDGFRWDKVSVKMAIDGGDDQLYLLSNGELLSDDVEHPTSGVSCTLDLLEVLFGH